jgi:hypothetical protein
MELAIILIRVRFSVLLQLRRILWEESIDLDPEDFFRIVKAIEDMSVDTDLHLLPPAIRPLRVVVPSSLMLEGEDLALVADDRVSFEVKLASLTDHHASGDFSVEDLEVILSILLAILEETTKSILGSLRRIDHIAFRRELFSEALHEGIRRVGDCVQIVTFEEEDFHRLMPGGTEDQMNVRLFWLPSKDVAIEVMSRTAHIFLNLRGILNAPDLKFFHLFFLLLSFFFKIPAR